MLVKWEMMHPSVTEEWCGLLLYMLDDEDDRSAKEQLNAHYQHGGGWRPSEGFRLLKNGIKYPGDPVLRPIAKAKLRDEEVVLYEYSWVAVIQSDGSYEIARMD